MTLPPPPTPPSDWSSDNWDGEKAKAKEQRSLIDFKLLEQQLQNTLQDTAQDIVPDKQEMDLINGMQDLTLEQDQNTAVTTDILVPPPDVPKRKHEEAKEGKPTIMYNMTDQEVRLQHEEEKYGIYKSTFGYEGDNSNLESKMDINSNAMAYPFLN